MTTWRVCLVAAVLGAVVVGTAGGRKPAAPRSGVFAALEVGQRVDLREGGGGFGFTLTALSSGPPGPKVVVGKPGGPAPLHKVVEVGADYVVLEEPRGVKQVRIPVSAVRAVVVPAAGKGK